MIAMLLRYRQNDIFAPSLTVVRVVCNHCKYTNFSQKAQNIKLKLISNNFCQLFFKARNHIVNSSCVFF